MLLRVLILFLICVGTFAAAAQQRILIAAASDLKFALDSVIVVYKQSDSGIVEVTYGSSGKLTEQIANGAPFDLFFSADATYPETLQKKGSVSSEIYLYGKGRLVLWSKKHDPKKLEMDLLSDPSIRKIAIANPQHAPYGKRAMESLQYYKIFDVVRSKLVYGENISQAAQFVSTGAADVGIIALSLALSPNMQRENGKYFILPEETHKPLLQGMVITSNGKDKKLAQSFFQFLKSERAVAILQYFGFERP